MNTNYKHIYIFQFGTGLPQARYPRGVCRLMVLKYLNNVGKGKDIKPPIVFQEVVSKNKGVFLDGWGNRCPAGIERMRKRFVKS